MKKYNKLYVKIHMDYRLNKRQLLGILEGWNRYLRRRVHLVACGGTAMTLHGVKPSTKDVDFMVPRKQEWSYLTKQLAQLGYGSTTQYGWEKTGESFRFDLFPGNRIHTTELLVSPLEKGGNTRLVEYSHLYIGILNDYDLISSKLMRGTMIDFDDCLKLVDAHRDQLNIDRLIRHFNEMVVYDTSVERLKHHIEVFADRLRENGLYG